MSSPNLVNIFFRIPEDWRTALRKKFRSDEGLGEFMRGIVEPLVNGDLELVRDESGAVVGMRRGEKPRKRRLSEFPKKGPRPKS